MFIVIELETNIIEKYNEFTVSGIAIRLHELYQRGEKEIILTSNNIGFGVQEWVFKIMKQ